VLDDVSFAPRGRQPIALGPPAPAASPASPPLGFGAPDRGSVYFDAQDLAGLAVQSVRRRSEWSCRPADGGSLFEHRRQRAGMTTLAAAGGGPGRGHQAMPMGMHTEGPDFRRPSGKS
jgi:hypothetical protein